MPTASPGQPLAAASLLQLIWLASPALPIGGFSYSEGLEAAVDRAGVDAQDSVQAWLRDQLQLSLERSDLAVLAKAVPAWRANDLAEIDALNGWTLQTRESSELRLQTEQMGRSLMDWLRNQHPDDTALLARSRHCASPSYPVAFALAASLSLASTHDCLLSYAFGWAENMVQAAVKSVPLGQSAGQRILAALSADIPAVVARALRKSDCERQAFSPMLAILSAQHETQYSRLFRS
ncbi:MAG: urease accessory protein UreF [Rhodoferax sp.]|nr:urease accessory protein UreF [Rhodoferax sp.]